MSLLTLKEASEQLNVSKITICNWVKKGTIDYILLPNGVRRYKIESITDKKKNLKRVRKKVLSMQESQPENKQTTSKDNLPSSEKNIQPIESSKTSEAELTSKEEVFSPWWTPYVKEVSQKLWLPTKTGCVDSDLTSLPTSSNNQVPTSWFSTTKQVPKKKSWFKTSFPLLPSSHAGLMELESIKNRLEKNLTFKKKKRAKRKKKKIDGICRNVDFRFYPTPEERLKLRQWLGTARYCYNSVISMFKNDKTIDLGNSTRETVLKNIPFDHSEVNLEVKRNAIEEAFVAISSGGNNFKFRSRKDRSESIYVRKECISTVKNTIFPTVFPTLSFKNKKLFKPEVDGRLVRKNKKWFLCIVQVKKPNHIQEKKGSNHNTICALDPGTSTFQTYYSNLDCGKIAPEAGSSVFRHCKRVDRLISESTKLPSKKKYKLKRAITREREKLKNKITDLHWKTASFLCSHYDHIFLSHFETQKMGKRGSRKIKSETVRKMFTLSHFLFSQRLISKAEETGTLVWKLHEPYTSQVCGNCFFRNKKLKLSDRTYICPECKCEVDRDYNGARNILLRGFNLLNDRCEKECKKEQGNFSLRWKVLP